MIQELKRFVKELALGQAKLPDLFIVARDANCNGYSTCVKEIRSALSDYAGSHVAAVPDPHIERWLLIDSQAFKQVFGQDCKAPDKKCNRDRYKQFLREAIRAVRIEPLLGGIEWAEDIIQAMDLDRAGLADASFGHLLSDLRAALRLSIAQL